MLLNRNPLNPKKILKITAVVLGLSSFSGVLLATTQAQSISTISPVKTKLSSSENITQKDNLELKFERHFKELGIEGSIIIYDSNRNHSYQYNPTRNQTPFLPASTFKILNSLIALETKVIADEKTVLTWDGIQRSIPGWNQDLNMREAFKVSAVWFYQILARRVGYEQMKYWVTQADYGNKTIGKAENIDHFWLDGELRITPQEQIQFLRRLYSNELPFSTRSLSLVKDIMVAEKTQDYTIRAKTGWESKGTPNIGWYVGYLEQNQNVYFFATNIDIHKPEDADARKVLTRRCLQDLSLALQ
ncbi:Beta-lactamase OXA-5 [Planktothrix tepida]|uniref:Beta-lactamase n=1 Tax=Planktothrix tepida PCC 9214 TaxID=671072 RepID=A0A1J1LGB2_9CYAN|nr:class D beta-lactamase [Planktothrix tepida]CAD5915549.1 Beta-lactamase OXA-5 [Planktothrix tepida]CUR30617.1 Beta-lactamase [Planktothrix tepida PCC 9214]